MCSLYPAKIRVRAQCRGREESGRASVSLLWLRPHLPVMLASRKPLPSLVSGSDSWCPTPQQEDRHSTLGCPFHHIPPAPSPWIRQSATWKCPVSRPLLQLLASSALCNPLFFSTLVKTNGCRALVIQETGFVYNCGLSCPGWSDRKWDWSDPGSGWGWITNSYSWASEQGSEYRCDISWSLRHSRAQV